MPPTLAQAMSDSTSRTTRSGPATAAHRGQSFVEFALVLPMLIVLLLGIADFGRVFHAGITIEAATRNAAEAAAQEYLQTTRNGGSVDYANLHLAAARSICDELQHLPNTTASGSSCPGWPIIRACVHDGVDTDCGAAIPGFNAATPGECEKIDGDGSPTTADDPDWSPVQDGGPETSVYVEVRACYLFTTLLNLRLSLPMNIGLSLGDVYLEDRSVFTVADY